MRYYEVYINNRPANKKSHLKDIQMIFNWNGYSEGDWRDFSPVFDPEQNNYFVSIDAGRMNDSLTLLPVLYDLSAEDAAVTGYQISYSIRGEDGTYLVNPTDLNGNLRINLPKAQMNAVNQVYTVEIVVL